jgi:ribosomal protein S15
LKQEREAAMGDPVLGTETPFIRSLNRMVSRSSRVVQKAASAALKPPAEGATFSSVAYSDPEARQGKPELVLSYGVRPSEFEEAAKRARLLTQPLYRAFSDVLNDEFLAHKAEHENATTAMARILSLTNGHYTDRRRLVRQQCVEKFGRHRTDQHLEPKPPADVPRDPSLPPPPQKTPRAGPDTGSPEVQIAILTMRIRSLASHLAGKGRTDKMNKRNLRLLVHKRQKLLKYLRRQDRGASRWQYVMETLGLTERMWNGEISLA